MPGLHSNRGAKRAREAREALGLPADRAPAGLLGAVEERGGAHVVVLDLGEGVAGAHVARPGCPLLFVNVRQPPARQRFTLAHELGHHRLGHATVVDRPQAFSDRRNELEVEANAFAAELLIPRTAIERWADEREPGPITLEDVVRIAAGYGVSAQMARYRLETTRVLRDRARADRLDAEIAAREHVAVAGYLGLSAPANELAPGPLPRIPAALRAGPIGRLLAGELDADGLAAQTGVDPAAVRRMLSNLGLAA